MKKFSASLLEMFKKTLIYSCYLVFTSPVDEEEKKKRKEDLKYLYISRYNKNRRIEYVKSAL